MVKKKTNLEESIEKSVERFGQFYPILVDDETNEVLDGRKRDLVIENPRIEKVKIQSPEHKMAIKYHNLWLREQVDGEKKKKILSEIAEETGWRGNKPFAEFFGVDEDTIGKYLPQKYKIRIKEDKKYSPENSYPTASDKEEEAEKAVERLEEAQKKVDVLDIKPKIKEQLKEAITKTKEEIKQTTFTPPSERELFDKWINQINPKTLSVWGCLDSRPEGYGDAEFHGNCSPTVIVGILNKFSNPDQTILDPMAGSGTFGDVAKAMGYTKVYMSDIRPMREDIEKRDAAHTEYEDNKFDLVFAHYPYWKLIQYTENDPLDASRLKYDDFMEWSENVFLEMKRIIRRRGYLIIMIGNLRDNGIIDLEAQLSIQGSKYFTLWDKIIKTIRTWAPETKGTRMGLAQARASEHNYSIVNHDTLLVFRND